MQQQRVDGGHSARAGELLDHEHRVQSVAVVHPFAPLGHHVGERLGEAHLSALDGQGLGRGVAEGEIAGDGAAVGHAHATAGHGAVLRLRIGADPTAARDGAGLVDGHFPGQEKPGIGRFPFVEDIEMADRPGPGHVRGGEAGASGPDHKPRAELVVGLGRAHGPAVQVRVQLAVLKAERRATGNFHGGGEGGVQIRRCPQRQCAGGDGFGIRRLMVVRAAARAQVVHAKRQFGPRCLIIVFGRAGFLKRPFPTALEIGGLVAAVDDLAQHADAGLAAGLGKGQVDHALVLVHPAVGHVDGAGVVAGKVEGTGQRALLRDGQGAVGEGAGVAARRRPEPAREVAVGIEHGDDLYPVADSAGGAFQVAAPPSAFQVGG